MRCPKKDTPEETHFLDYCQSNGLAPRRVSRDPEKETADYLVDDAPDTYLVEVKGRHPDFFRLLSDRADKAGVAYGEQGKKASNSVSSTIEKAARQLAATKESAQYRLLWFSNLTPACDSVFEEITRTLYGIEHLAVFDQRLKRVGVGMTCFYYGHAAFHRFQDIVACCLASKSGIDLCLNEFAPSLRAFRGSSLYSLFDTSRVCDPEAMERFGRAFAIRADFPKRDEESCRRYLRETYGCNTSRLATIESAFEVSGILDGPPLGAPASRGEGAADK